MTRKLTLLLLSLWLGIGVGVGFVAVPYVFSPPIRDSIPEGRSGQIAQGMLHQFFVWQIELAGAVLLLHLWGWRKQQDRPDPVQSALLPLLLGLSAASLFWLHPRLLHLFEDKYRLDLDWTLRESAAHAFGRWHGVSQMVNLVTLIGVLACWWRLAQPRAQVPQPERNEPTGGNDAQGPVEVGIRPSP